MCYQSKWVYIHQGVRGQARGRTRESPMLMGSCSCWPHTPCSWVVCLGGCTWWQVPCEQSPCWRGKPSHLQSVLRTSAEGEGGWSAWRDWEGGEESSILWNVFVPFCSADGAHLLNREEVALEVTFLQQLNHNHCLKQGMQEVMQSQSFGTHTRKGFKRNRDILAIIQPPSSVNVMQKWCNVMCLVSTTKITWDAMWCGTPEKWWNIYTYIMYRL